jgi:hypothetical protein
MVKFSYSVFVFCLVMLVLTNQIFSQAPSYPRIVGYVGIVQPIVSFSDSGTTTNFKDSYIVGIPVGINIWKSATIGFSLEFVPFIKAEKGTSKMNNFLFQPGILVSMGNGFTFAGRVTFETSGRYGITPVFNYVFIKNKSSSYYVAIPLPVRFGNNMANSVGISFQLGIAF